MSALGLPDNPDLKATLADLMHGKGGWRLLWEVDVENGWWLAEGGRRMHRNPWRPADEIDVLVAVTLLYIINDAGPVPITGRFLDAAKQHGRKTEEALREALYKAAHTLYLDIRIRRYR